MGYKLQITADKKSAKSLIETFENNHDDLFSALGYMDVENASLRIEIYFHEDLAETTILSSLKPVLEGHNYTLEKLPEIDWVKKNQQDLKPVQAGRFFVYGHHDAQLVPPNAHKILMEAATAFGTGHHGTTKGCLIALDLLGKKMRPGKVLDVGCGSGILAIAAAKKFKAQIIAADIDPEAVEVTRGNVRQNQVWRYIHTCPSRGLGAREIGLHAPYDLVLANILPGPLCSMALDMNINTHKGSCLILSGILATQARRVEARYRQCGFVLGNRLRLAEWVTLILFRK